MSTASVIQECRRRGRPPLCPHEIAIRVIDLRRQGLSYSEIATALNREGVPTPMGGSLWYKSCVDRLLHTQYVRELWEATDTGLTKAVAGVLTGGKQELVV